MGNFASGPANEVRIFISSSSEREAPAMEIGEPIDVLFNSLYQGMVVPHVHYNADQGSMATLFAATVLQQDSSLHRGPRVSTGRWFSFQAPPPRMYFDTVPPALSIIPTTRSTEDYSLHPRACPDHRHYRELLGHVARQGFMSASRQQLEDIVEELELNVWPSPVDAAGPSSEAAPTTGEPASSLDDVD